MPEPKYKTFSYALINKGIVARYVLDRLPPSTYMNLDGWECRQENSLGSKFGVSSVTNNGVNNTPLADTNVHTIGRMKAIGTTYRYAGAGANIYRRTGDTNGAYATINGASALSGNRFSMGVYRPDASAKPYSFFADSLQMLKDDGTFSPAQKWGILPPTVPVSLTVLDPGKTDIELFEANAGFTFVNYTGVTNPNRVNTTLSVAIAATGVQAATPVSMANIVPGAVLQIDAGGNLEAIVVISITSTQLTANFTKTHLAGIAIVDKYISGSIAANTTATVSKAAALDLSVVGGITATDEDLITLFLNVSDPAAIQEIRIIFDVGDGSFTQDYYLKSITKATWQDFVSASKTAGAQITGRVFDRAGGGIDVRRMGKKFSDLLPDDDDVLHRIRPGQLLTGLSRWTTIQVARSDFSKVGLADGAGHDWSVVNSFRISIQTVSSGSATVGLDDLYISGGSDLDVFAGTPYDWRVTYLNVNTGLDSNPSPTLIDASMASPRRQAVKVSWAASADPQVTHAKVWRRGGNLVTGWFLVAKVPIGTTTYTDTIADSIIVNNEILEIDNDPPCTVALPVPVSTTLGTGVSAGSTQFVTPANIANISANMNLIVGNGNTQETVIVQAVVGATFSAYFQYAHGSAEQVDGSAKVNQAMNLMALAFDRAWLAGDPNNPHFLFYSKTTRPESFPPENFLEIGTPKDPIMGLIEGNGSLLVATLTRWYRILAPAGSNPVAIPLASRHGLAANFGYAIGEGGDVWYRSQDGVRIVRGGASQFASEAVDWVFTGQNLGPVVAQDLTQITETYFSYYDKKLFISYMATDGKRRRMIWEDLYQRWRNDSLAVNAMYVEDDTNLLMVSLVAGTAGFTSGMIYKDRVNDYYSTGFAAGVEGKVSIPLAFQSGAIDQGEEKAFKNYQEMTIEADTQGQDLTVQVSLDDGTPPQLVGTLNCNGRRQVQMPALNGSFGYSCEHLATLISGSVTKLVTIYAIHVRAALQAESRRAYDSYFLDYGVTGYKVVKQGWFDYISLDAAGVAFSVYVNGETSPRYTFTLPQSTVRRTIKIRFPDVKAKLWRFIATSASDFQLYGDCHVELKPLGMTKGYTNFQLVA